MRNPTALAVLFLTASLSVNAQGIVIDPPTLHRWAANRALADTLLDEAEGDYQSARRIIGGLRADLDTCSAIAQRSNERFDAATFELDQCNADKGKLTNIVRRRGFTAWALWIVAALEGALLYITAKP